MPVVPQEHTLKMPVQQQQRRHQQQHHHTEPAVEITNDEWYDGPVDLDELFMPSNLEHAADEEASYFSDDDMAETLPLADGAKYFNNPHKRVSC